MSKLNRDILYLIFQELQSSIDKKSLCSCILVNKTWCEIIIPILWKNPWKYLENGNLLLNVIISHLSDESINNLKNKGFDFFINSLLYKKPLFDYISFCKHLNLNEIQRIINTIYDENFNTNILESEIINLFINNENTKFTHLYIPQQFDHQIHLIPGAERCFSEIKFLSCNTNINDYTLDGLTEICKPIKELELLFGYSNNNYGIIKLIETPNKLFNIHFLNNNCNFQNLESFYAILENSMIKHSSTIEVFKITKPLCTNILSSFINLKILELSGNSLLYNKWIYLENLSLPFLQILRAKSVPIKTLTSLIENTNGYLTEIRIDHVTHDSHINRKIIRAIYQNCPNLKYIKLMFRSGNVLELKKLLINCQNLNGLYILTSNTRFLDDFFGVIAKSSPNSLFKFKFKFNTYYCYYEPIKLNSLKLFFDIWKLRNNSHPMLLQFNVINIMEGHYDLIENYKKEGVIKEYNNYLHGEDFEWI